MDIQTIEKAYEIHTEINELKEINKMLKDNKQGRTVHFEVLQHYGGDIGHCKKVLISRKHNDILLHQVNNILKGLEAELERL